MRKRESEEEIRDKRLERGKKGIRNWRSEI